jgi:uncharacterized protein
MHPTLDLSAALMLGILGSTHCIGMCGGISGALAFALDRNCTTLRRYFLVSLYSVGRVGSYAFMGALAGAAGGALSAGGQGAWLRIVAGLMLVLMGLNLAGWSSSLRFVEQLGHGLWRRIQGPFTRLLPVDNAAKALMAGAAWGWLPCGLVYSTLTWSGTSGSAASGALFMLVFGIGTAPAVIASGVLATNLRNLLQKRSVRAIAGLVIIAFGIWTLAVVLPLGQDPHAHHHH